MTIKELQDKVDGKYNAHKRFEREHRNEEQPGDANWNAGYAAACAWFRGELERMQGGE